MALTEAKVASRKTNKVPRSETSKHHGPRYTPRSPKNTEVFNDLPNAPIETHSVKVVYEKPGSKEDDGKKMSALEKMVARYIKHPIIVRDTTKRMMVNTKVVENSTNPVQQYKNEASRFSLLNREREVELATCIKDGLKAWNALPDASDTEHGGLEQLAIEGVKAYKEFVDSNLRLVLWQSQKFENGNHDMHFLDLVQYGNTGLMHAVELFDPSKGFRFSTYATWWIRQAIIRGIENTKEIVRLSVDIDNSRKEIERFTEYYLRDHGIEPTDEIIIASTRVKPDQINALWRFGGMRLRSTNNSIGDGDAELGEQLEDRNAVDPQEIYDPVGRQKEIIEIFDNVPLTHDERLVLALQHGVLVPGIDPEEILRSTPEGKVTVRDGIRNARKKQGEITLKEIADQLGEPPLSGERVRQLRITAEIKLKKAPILAQFAAACNMDEGESKALFEHFLTSSFRDLDAEEKVKQEKRARDVLDILELCYEEGIGLSIQEVITSHKEEIKNDKDKELITNFYSRRFGLSSRIQRNIPNTSIAKGWSSEKLANVELEILKFILENKFEAPEEKSTELSKVTKIQPCFISKRNPLNP